MKRNRHITTAILAVLAFTGGTLSAATLSWDNDGSGTPGGGAGTWNTTDLRWTSDSGANYVAWSNTGQDSVNLDDAVFGGSVGTVTLGVPIVVHNLTFNSDGYVISDGGNATNTLTLGGTSPVITLAPNATTTISAVIAGTAGFTKATSNESGVLILSGNNTYSGQTTISNGTIRITHGNALGATGAVDKTVLGISDVLEMAGNITVGEDIDIAAGSARLFNSSGNSTLTGTLRIFGASSGIIEVAGGQKLTIDGILDTTTTNGKQVHKNGDGTLVVNSTNAGWVQNLIINAGTVTINGSRGTSNSSSIGRTDVENSATLGGRGTIWGRNIDISNTGFSVNVKAGGTLSPGDPEINDGVGTLTIRKNLQFANTSILNFDLANVTTIGADVNDLIDVIHASNTDLILDGIVNINAVNGMLALGTYRLINYSTGAGNSFTDNGLELGIIPAGHSMFIDTSVAGQVNLVVTAIPEPGTLALAAIGGLTMFVRGRRR